MFFFVLFLSPRVCIQSTVWVNLTGSLTSIVPMCLESSNCKLAQYNINIHNVHYSGIWGRKMWRGSYVSHLPFCDNDVSYSAEWSHSHNQFFKHTSLDFTSSHFLSCLIKVWFFFSLHLTCLCLSDKGLNLSLPLPGHLQLLLPTTNSDAHSYP